MNSHFYLRTTLFQYQSSIEQYEMYVDVSFHSIYFISYIAWIRILFRNIIESLQNISNKN